MNKRRIDESYGPNHRTHRNMDRHISGVLDYVKLSSPDRTQKVLLFGDYHTLYKGEGCNGCDDTTCPDFFISVLEDIILSAGSDIVDFYIEQDILPDKSEPSDANIIIGLTRKYFADCYKKNKVACRTKWPNLRYHYADSRIDSRSGLYSFKSDVEGYYKGDGMNYMMYCFNYIDVFDKKAIVTNLNEYLQNYPDYSDVLHEFIRTPRMQKQFAGVPKRIRKSVLKNIYNVVYERRNSYIKLQNHVAHLIATKTYDDFDEDYLIFPVSGLMDMYLMTRVFRYFKADPTGTPKPQDKVIIYAGVDHIMLYSKIFTLLGYTQEQESLTTDKVYCKKIENFDKWW